MDNEKLKNLLFTLMLDCYRDQPRSVKKDLKDIGRLAGLTIKESKTFAEEIWNKW